MTSASSDDAFPAGATPSGRTRRPASLPSFRVLFTSLPFISHLQGQLPLAMAMRAAGNDVRFATTENFAGTIADAGFDVTLIGYTKSRIPDAALALRTASEDEPMFPWMPAAARAAPELIRSFEQWHPDIVVRDPLDFAACLAAEQAGLPHVVGREGPFWSREILQSAVGADLDSLRGQLGLPPDPETEMPYRYLSFAFVPPELLPPDLYVPPSMHFIQPSPMNSVSELDEISWPRPGWGTQFVYATIGTVFNEQHRELLIAIMEAMSGEPYQALVTTGPRLDRSALPEVAGNLTVLGYVPQNAVLPHCDVLVAHGGFLTVMGALLHGVPMVLVPLGGDQHRNAEWCSARGAAVVLDDTQRTATSIRAAIEQVRTQTSYREAAEKLQFAISELPDMEMAVCMVEQVASMSLPIWRPGAYW